MTSVRSNHVCSFEQFNVDMFNANTVKAAAFGILPVTMDSQAGMLYDHVHPQIQ